MGGLLFLSPACSKGGSQMTVADEDKLPGETFTSVYPKDTTPPQGTRYPCAFTPLPKDMKGIPAYHHKFMDGFCALLVQGIHARLRAELALYRARQKKTTDEESARAYQEKVDELVTKLSGLTPPSTLKKLPGQVARALALQKEIYLQALKGGDLDRQKHSQSGSLLRGAWNTVDRRFPKKSPAVKKSLFHHFCALDISGSTKVFEKK